MKDLDAEAVGCELRPQETVLENLGKAHNQFPHNVDEADWDNDSEEATKQQCDQAQRDEQQPKESAHNAHLFDPRGKAVRLIQLFSRCRFDCVQNEAQLPKLYEVELTFHTRLEI